MNMSIFYHILLLLVLCKEIGAHSGRVKASGFEHRKWVHIDLILTHLRCSNRESFHAAQNEHEFSLHSTSLIIEKRSL